MAKSKVTLAVNGVGEFEGKAEPGADGVGRALASAIADWAEGQPASKGTFTEILTGVLSGFTAGIEAKLREHSGK